MASYKMNFAQLEGCPPPGELAKAMDAYGLPDNKEFGVLATAASDAVCYGTVVRKVNQAIQRLDEHGEVSTTAVEKVQVFPIGAFPQRSRLEVYEGSATGIDQVAAFLASALGLATVVTALELDIPAAIGRLRNETERFQLKSIRVSEYAHDSYMLGPYTPKFLESEHGIEFLSEYADFVTSASVAFRGPHGRVTVGMNPKACFRFSCANEDDKPAVQALLRKLI